MATPKSTAPKARVSRSDDLYEILAQFSAARSFLEVAYTVLDDTQASDATVCMEHGLSLLKAAYRELDRAIPALQR
jgi:hypothetical protein